MSRSRAGRRLPAVLIALLLLVVPASAAASPGRPYPGVRERGALLGRESAPVRIVLFADLKCPVCTTFERTVLPTIVRRLVRTGRASIELRLVDIIDRNVGTTDGERLRTAALNLAGRNRMWSFALQALRSQGPEDQEWATPETIATLGASAGVSVGPEVLRKTAASRRAARSADALFRRLEGQGTPQMFVRPRDHATYVSTENSASAVERTVARIERRRR